MCIIACHLDSYAVYYGSSTSNRKKLVNCLEIKLGILFGSAGRGQARVNRHIDLAVAADQPLEVSGKVALIEELAQPTARPVDFVDLQLADDLALQEMLTKGKQIYCTDSHLHAGLIKCMFFNEADFVSYRDRIVAEPRKAWISP